MLTRNHSFCGCRAGCPQGFVPSPLLQSCCSTNAQHKDKRIVKITDDTVMLGLLWGVDFVDLCGDRCLQLNTLKANDEAKDFRRT